MEFTTWSQLIALKATFCWIRIAINNAVTVAPKSNNRITNLGTILKFLILNIFALNSFNLGEGVNGLINYRTALQSKDIRIKIN